MKSLGALTKLRRVAGRCKRYWQPRALILLYHSICEAATDPWSLSVTPQHFAEHLQALQGFGTPLSLRQLAQRLEQGRLPRRAVVVTFDDGYANNLYAAKPLLERYEIPATVFVSTGGMAQTRAFWWDELDRLLLQPGTLPARLSLPVNGTVLEWDLKGAAEYAEAERRVHHHWRAWDTHKPTPRHGLYHLLYERLFQLPHSVREEAMLSLERWAASVAPAAESKDITLRVMSAAEINTLAQGGLIEVGAHTVTHTRLSDLTPAAQRTEIVTSKTQLEAILNHPVTSFAYPFGRQSDYTAQTVALIREAGFDAACSNFMGLVTAGTDRYQLPRGQVQDITGEELARRLAAWFAD